MKINKLFFRDLFCIGFLFTVLQWVFFLICVLIAKFTKNEIGVIIETLVFYSLWCATLPYIYYKAYSDIYLRQLNNNIQGYDDMKIKKKRIVRLSLIFAVISAVFLLYVCGRCEVYSINDVGVGIVQAVWQYFYPTEVISMYVFLNSSVSQPVLFLIHFCLHLIPVILSIVAINRAYENIFGKSEPVKEAATVGETSHRNYLDD